MRLKIFIVLLVTFSSGLIWAGSTLEPDTDKSSDETSPKLNSERIRQKFGSYGIDVLEQDQQLRISSLYSIEDGQKVTRTLAVVIYPERIPAEIQLEHETIRAGGSMGEVFKENGWSVEKASLYFGDIPASQDFDQIYRLMGVLEPVPLAVHLYELSVCGQKECFAYATLAEVHSPEYLTLAELEHIYGVSVGTNTVQDGEVQASLDSVLAAMAAQ
jgi:hypothetical protein